MLNILNYQRRNTCSLKHYVFKVKKYARTLIEGFFITTKTKSYFMTFLFPEADVRGFDEDMPRERSALHLLSSHTDMKMSQFDTCHL